MPPASAQPRAIGALTVTAKRRGAASVLDDLRQSGAARVLFPARGGPGLLAVTLNTAGGITGGDRFTLQAAAHAGARLTLTTQAAERLYRAQPGEIGRVTTVLHVADDARIDWLPQETILFDRAALERRLTVHLAPRATLLLAEPLILGRAAMGETVHLAHLHDRIAVHRGGVPLFADALRLEGRVAAQMARPGALGGAGALAAVLLISAVAEYHLGAARALLTQAGSGVSLIAPGVLFARLTAADGHALRALLMPLLVLLREAPLPRVWTM